MMYPKIFFFMIYPIEHLMAWINLQKNMINKKFSTYKFIMASYVQNRTAVNIYMTVTIQGYKRHTLKNAAAESYINLLLKHSHLNNCKDYVIYKKVLQYPCGNFFANVCAK